MLKAGTSSVPRLPKACSHSACSRWRRVLRASCLRSPYVLSITTTSAAMGALGAGSSGVYGAPRSPENTTRCRWPGAGPSCASSST